jgi:hypothetical protein
MKITLKISVLLNVMFLSWMLLLWRHPRTVTVLVPEKPAITAKVEPETAPAPVVQTVASPFHWNQLLSSNDYRSLVANLRTAGCPESTVEDIVRGDTGRAYSVMRDRLKVNPAEPGPWSAQAQTQMVAYFLGEAQAPEADPPPLPLLAAAPPLVLQNVDLSTLNLDEAQNQAIANIRATFWNSVGGANQDTKDPGYLARWQKAQSQADDTLHAMLGEQDFLQYQVKAYQMSLQNQETPAGN